MKVTYRIPTAEQYAYVEVEGDEKSAESIAENYRNLTKAITGGTGMDTKDFNKVLDKYIWGDGTMLADEYAAMNLEQQSIIQCIKRSRARNKGKLPDLQIPGPGKGEDGDYSGMD